MTKLDAVRLAGVADATLGDRRLHPQRRHPAAHHDAVGLAGRLCANVHASARPDGGVRGQLMAP